MCTSVLDIANRENVGFSHFVSLGSMLDIDFADMIDYLGSLNSVTSIVMYMENITHIRNFMSAARSVSRLKPIIVLKSGRSKAGARAAASHTGAMAGEDAVYDAAFERAGILRVNEFEELFDCSEFLAKQRRPSGPGLTIITNGGGPGVMAADALTACGLDTLSLADSLTDYLKTAPCPVFAAWIGEDNVQKARQAFNQAGIMTYDSAERAVQAFKNLYHYGKNVEMLNEIPVRKDVRLIINREEAGQIIGEAIASGEPCLTEIRAKGLLRSYGIPVNITKIAESEEEAVQIFEHMGFPVVLKICSKDILHKTDCNGVVLNLKTSREVRDAYTRIMKNAGEFAPGADIKGVSVQAMHDKADYELIIGAKQDDQFGPVILFGMGGVLTEVFKNVSMGLPPLNHMLARQMIEKTKISKVLNCFRNIPKTDIQELEEILIRLGRLVTDFPEITALDINPLMVKNGRIVAVDARVLIAPANVHTPMHLIISSYPWQYESQTATVDGHPFFIRPIRPTDADFLIEHFNTLSPRSIYMRFFAPLKQLSKKTLIKTDTDRL